MTKFLKAYGVKNYRSFGGDGIIFDDLKNINIFIGRNNTGKSNVLSALKLYADKASGDVSPPIDIMDYFKSDNTHPLEFYLELYGLAGFDSLLTPENHQIFVKHQLHDSSITVVDSFVMHASKQNVIDYCSAHFNTYSSDESQNINQIQNQPPFTDIFKLPNVVYISDARQSSLTSLPRSVKGRLQAIWHHGFRNPQMKPIKEALYNFIKEAIDSDFDLQFDPGNNDEFSVAMGDSLTNFTSLGKGVQQVFELALSVATTQNSIVLIDEPELNMHPNLVRQLMRLVFANNTNQYFISTHSNVLLDTDFEKSIYRIFHDTVTKVEQCVTMAKSRELLDDLGVKASDLLQTNGIIWVEGPSDRTYINRWLELAGSSFAEGLHYTFQYYGGKLLSHLTLDDDIEEFVNILNINRNAYIVMDSDWAGPDSWNTDNLAVRKKKIITEAAKINVPLWVTAGREIENYVPDTHWSTFAGAPIELKKYEKVTDKIALYKSKALKSHIIANNLVEHDLKSYDLQEKVSEIMTAITEWNQL